MRYIVSFDHTEFTLIVPRISTVCLVEPIGGVGGSGVLSLLEQEAEPIRRAVASIIAKFVFHDFLTYYIDGLIGSKNNGGVLPPCYPNLIELLCERIQESGIGSRNSEGRTLNV